MKLTALQHMNRLVKSFSQAGTTNTINGIVDEESRGHVLADVTEKSGIRFQGQLMHGVKHGFGELSLPSGQWVRGRWAFNTLTGVGAYYGDGGALYEGHFENGVQEGMGVEVMPSGDLLAAVRGGSCSGCCFGHLIDLCPRSDCRVHRGSYRARLDCHVVDAINYKQEPQRIRMLG